MAAEAVQIMLIFPADMSQLVYTRPIDRLGNFWTCTRACFNSTHCRGYVVNFNCQKDIFDHVFGKVSGTLRSLLSSLMCGSLVALKSQASRKPSFNN